MKAYVQTKCERPDESFDCYQTTSVPVKTTDRPWKGRTQSGYGRALPTDYMVLWNGRWQRVKCICFSNSGTLYIGRAYSHLRTIRLDGEE